MKSETYCRVEGREEVSTRMSVSRFDDLYALSAARPCMSLGSKVDA